MGQELGTLREERGDVRMEGGRMGCGCMVEDSCVWLRWMAGEEEEEGMVGIYYFAMPSVSAGGGGWYLGVDRLFLSV